MRDEKWRINRKDLVWFIICLLIIICFFVGIFVSKNHSESLILSGASTAVSIVLSVVAIIYTMIEGSNSSRINQDSINKLSSIDKQLNSVVEKLTELRSLDKKIRNIIPVISTMVEEVRDKDKGNESIEIDKDIEKDLNSLLSYIKEDFDL